MDQSSFEQLKRAIERRSKNLKNPPKENQTNRSQTEKEIKGLRKDRKAIVEFLINESYADSLTDADAIFNLMSEQWLQQIIEAIQATKATVRGIKVQGSAQKRRALEDRKEEAMRRAEERKAEIEKEREYARERRENPQILKREAQKRTLSSRMEKAAEKLGLQ